MVSLIGYVRFDSNGEFKEWQLENQSCTVLTVLPAVRHSKEYRRDIYGVFVSYSYTEIIKRAE